MAQVSKIIFAAFTQESLWGFIIIMCHLVWTSPTKFHEILYVESTTETMVQHFSNKRFMFIRSRKLSLAIIISPVSSQNDKIIKFLCKFGPYVDNIFLNFLITLHIFSMPVPEGFSATYPPSSVMTALCYTNSCLSHICADCGEH